MVAVLARLALGLAASGSLAAATASQAQLRGAGNATASSLLSGAKASSHIAWSSSASFCLSTDGNRVGNGVKVQLWQCDQTWQSGGQNFYLGKDGRIRMHQDPEYCVVVDGNDFRNGAKVQLWKCSEHNQNQVWSFGLAGQITARQASAPMCMVIDGNRAFNGAKIQLWSCSEGASKQAQDWLQVVLGAGGRTAYAVPNEDKACESPFAPVSVSAAACAAAAEALKPGQGCQWSGSPLKGWAQVVSVAEKPSWPKGCYFYGACQGGCSLDYNPAGEGAFCPTQGDCMSIDVICQLSLP